MAPYSGVPDLLGSVSDQSLQEGQKFAYKVCLRKVEEMHLGGTLPDPAYEELKVYLEQIVESFRE